ncbi:M48 family metalloprotease [uncultured Sphingomonas sp.]|uniref:M48 family metalloprotease n=1 Tax=uncultured Sphingomonas sp. TaxID=158754 RepID=UPI0025E982FA|nr:M48 family metalloprotease [uncultured Sphingomonas sp.]
MSRLFRLACAAVISLTLVTQPVLAQSILRDAETEAFMDDIAAPLAASAGLRPGALNIYVINDPSINAFVATGQNIYFHSGTLQRADNAAELEGVIAHELGHIETGGAELTAKAGMESATRISLLSLLLGAAAMAAGAGEAGMAALMAGQSAAQGKFLAFTRAAEGGADAAAVRHLNDAKLSGKGMISFFGKLRQEEYRLTPSYTSVDPFGQSHPMTADRQAALEADLQKSPWWDTPIDPTKQQRFLRIKAKLTGYLEDPPVVMRKYPERDQSIPAHYARAYAWHRGGYPDKANEEVAKLLASDPHDPYFLELKGQILLEAGRPADALPALREATRQSRSTPLIASLLGNALVATENKDDLKEAEQVLKVAVQRDPDNPQAWYNLGLIYTRLGDEPRARLATAERYSMEGNAPAALANAELAMRSIPVGTPDYIRAQDIALTARDAADRRRRR